VARELERLVARSARYEEAMRRAIEFMEESEPRGGRSWRREDLVATRRSRAPMRRTTARRIVTPYAEWPVVRVDVALLHAASELEERHTLPFGDALIVEAARRSGATRLLTEDLQHGRVVGGVSIENPFA
jgi:predicted nucleic acid-binding protein